MKLSKEDIVNIISLYNNELSSWYDEKDVEIIKDIIWDSFGICLSTINVLHFWSWRSRIDNSDWSCAANESKDNILNYFKIFIKKNANR